MDLKKNIQTESERLLEDIIAIRRHLHQHPELSFHETNTSAYIRALLDDWGIAYDYPYVEHGFLARLGQGLPGKPVIALRTDMDALPILEETEVPFCSTNEGVMHACGHDVHMASLLGAIRILKGMEKNIPGLLLFIFQPGEEKLPGGAKLMMEEGLFSTYTPDYILAQHVLPEMETGNVGFRAGEYMASSDEIYITVNGKGGHGALPEKISDPILMASHILISLQQEINRKAPRGTPTVLSFGKVIANGATNVIPDKVYLEGTFRTMNETWRKDAHQVIKQIAEGIAGSMGGSVDLEIRHGYPVLKNDPGLTERAKKLAVELLGNEHVSDMSIRMTAEDFGWFSQEYPVVMYRLGVKNPSSGDIMALHTSRFSPDENALLTGMSLLAYLAASLAG